MNAKTMEAIGMVEKAEPSLRAIVESYGIGLASCGTSTSISISERKQGIFARLGVLLADDKPGWRQKDGAHYVRREMKKEIANKLFEMTGKKWSVHIKAGYSCLEEINGVVYRKNREGNVIGAYLQ